MYLSKNCANDDTAKWRSRAKGTFQTLKGTISVKSHKSDVETEDCDY